MAFKKLYSWSMWFFEQVLILITALLAVLVVAAVFSRYVLSRSLTWSDEMAGFLLVWVTFLGAVTALERGKHINFDGVITALPHRLRRPLEMVAEGFLFVFLGVQFWFGLQMSTRLMNQTAASMPIPIGIIYSIMPISGLLMMVVLVYRWIVPREFATGHEAEISEATQ